MLARFTVVGIQCSGSVSGIEALRIQHMECRALQAATAFPILKPRLVQTTHSQQFLAQVRGAGRYSEGSNWKDMTRESTGTEDAHTKIINSRV